MADRFAGAMSPVLFEALPQASSAARVSIRLADVDHLRTLDPSGVEISAGDRGILAFEPPCGAHVAVRPADQLIAKYDVDSGPLGTDDEGSSANRTNPWNPAAAKPSRVHSIGTVCSVIEHRGPTPTATWFKRGASSAANSSVDVVPLNHWQDV
jgi:hypothetical protein